MGEKQIRRKASVWIGLIGIVMVLAAGCSHHQGDKIPDPSVAGTEIAGDDKASVGYTFTDDLGRSVTVSKPQRVAALLGSFADIWYLAGGEICACADDAWEDFDLPLPESAVNLGMTKELSLEKLFEADPDFVLASKNTQGNLDWMDTLEMAGIPVAYFEVSDVEDYLRVLKICTEITGREDLYRENGEDVRRQIDEVIAHSEERIKAAGKAPSVLSLRASSTFIRAKNSKNNVLGEMLASLGCVNIADSDASLLENLDPEHIMICDPDYIFFIQQGDNEEGTKKNIDQFIAENPAWSQLTAVREGRVYLLEKALYALKPNDRWGEAYEKLERILSDE